MIRPVRPADAADLLAIDVAVLRDGRGQVRGADHVPTLASLEARIARHLDANDRGGMWVADAGGEVVGEAVLDRFSVSMCSHVASLALQVHPSHQGKGLGKALLDAVVARAAETGVRRLELYVRADNERAIGLYRAGGFATESVRPAFVRLPDGAFVDDLVMVRHLGPVRKEKACAVVVRGESFLVLQHPQAGWQLPKGTIEPGETPAEAVVREVAEETGLADLPVVRSLGSWTVFATDGAPHRWHAFVLAAPDGTADAWEHRPTGSAVEEALVFRLSFLPLDAVDGGPWNAFHPAFHEPLFRLCADR